ncbi:MAG TPA: crotonase/enoyl-CoA hydratase family protein [Bryobacteraceae bacterium]|jgi:enoyl-CoA hydratase/carnithine racemase
MSTLTTEQRGHLWLMGLNRTAKRNAFDPAMFFELAEAYGELERNPDLWCGVLFAHGKDFSGGIDLAAFAPLFEGCAADPFASRPGTIDPFGLRNHLTKPLVTAVQGISFTIAIELLLASDIRIAANDVRFAQIEVARGLYPLGGATFRLVREAGWGNAMRYLLTGEEFGAEVALKLGLIQEIVEPGQQVDRAIAIAAKVAEQAPLGVRATLKSAWISVLEGEAAATARVAEDMPGILSSDDFAEGVASFRERRKAEFRGK